MHQHFRNTFSVPGTLGILILLTWAIGWMLFGMHGGFYHVLVPIGIVLCGIQIVRRINAD